MNIYGVVHVSDTVTKVTFPEDCTLVAFTHYPSASRDITLPPAVGNLNGDPSVTSPNDVLSNSGVHLNIQLRAKEDYYIHSTGTSASAAGYVVFQLFTEPMPQLP